MKRANMKRHDLFDAAQTRLRLLISALQDGEPAAEDDDLESLDFTSPPEPQADEAVGEAGMPSEDAIEDQ